MHKCEVHIHMIAYSSLVQFSSSPNLELGKTKKTVAEENNENIYGFHNLIDHIL